MSLQVAQSTSVFGVFAGVGYGLARMVLLACTAVAAPTHTARISRSLIGSFNFLSPKKLDRRMENRGLANVIRGHVGLTSIRYNNYFTKETGGSCIVFGGYGKDHDREPPKTKRRAGEPARLVRQLRWDWITG
jgi:hypothetical protein